MNKRRLEMVAAKLMTVPPERFNYKHWIGDDWKGRPDLSCGTSACALGWATTIPALRRAGLYAVDTGIQHTMIRLRGLHFDARSRYASGIAAAAKLFDISIGEAVYLFVPSIRHYTEVHDGRPSPHATAKQVARHIRRFCLRGGIPRRYAKHSDYLDV